MSIHQQRMDELKKYERAYAQKGRKYTMSERRYKDACKVIGEQPYRYSLLDVSCGNGQILAYARERNFQKVMGTETIKPLLNDDVVYALGHKLPFEDNSFQVVTMFDVIEHLLPGDDELTFKELCRVAEKCVILTANNGPSRNEAGDDLHINKRPYSKWEQLFNEWSPIGAKVTCMGSPFQDEYYRNRNTRRKASPAWRIDL